VAVDVPVAVGVALGVSDAVFVGTGVKVVVAVLDGIGVSVLMAVLDGVGAMVGVCVSVGIAEAMGDAVPFPVTSKMSVDAVHLKEIVIVRLCGPTTAGEKVTVNEQESPGASVPRRPPRSVPHPLTVKSDVSPSTPIK
jgi:hypothetical protein